VLHAAASVLPETHLLSMMKVRDAMTPDPATCDFDGIEDDERDESVRRRVGCAEMPDSNVRRCMIRSLVTSVAKLCYSCTIIEVY